MKKDYKNYLVMDVTFRAYFGEVKKRIFRSKNQTFGNAIDSFRKANDLEEACIVQHELIPL